VAPCADAGDGGEGPAAGTIHTVGHSTHPLERLIELLRGHGVGLLVDVRTVPRSRRSPHVDARALGPALEAGGIAYRHMPSLGGWRRPRPDSPNLGWRNAAFRGYADHMQGPEFAAVMCAEALWWRCHRRLVADALAVRGWRVRHIGPDGTDADHVLTPFARPEGDALLYPREGEDPTLF
jgi:uncharacterized protein (DUF488 family)